MSTPRLAVFDDGSAQLGPMTDLRAAFDLRTGAVTTLERIERCLGRSADVLLAPPALEGLVRHAHPDTPVNTPLAGDHPTLLLSGRCATAAVIRQAAGLPHQAALVTPRGRLVAAHATLDMAQDQLQLPDGLAVASAPDDALFERPWDIIRTLDTNLTDDLAACALPTFERGRADVHVLGGHTVHVGAGRLHPLTVLNVEKGPIVIDRSAIVGSFSVLAGPCYIGRHTIVAPHTHVRAFTSVGPDCVVAGEVSWSIIQGLSNKSHAGYLGHSLLGEWVNLGAGTTVSNLKNTYGHVRMQLAPDGVAHDSGLTKLGPVIGDHVRTAIGTRLLTGSCIGTATMLGGSGFAPKFTGRFSFCTDEGGVARYDIERLLATTRTAMNRRGQELAPALEARLRALAHNP